jgi:hypothetical protein
MNNMSVRHWRRVESYYHARRVSQWRTVRCVIARAEHALEGIFCVFAGGLLLPESVRYPRPDH